MAMLIGRSQDKHVKLSHITYIKTSLLGESCFLSGQMGVTLPRNFLVIFCCLSVCRWMQLQQQSTSRHKALDQSLQLQQFLSSSYQVPDLLSLRLLGRGSSLFTSVSLLQGANVSFPGVFVAQ